MLTINYPKPTQSKQHGTTPKIATHGPEIVGPFVDYLSITVSRKTPNMFAPHKNAEAWLAYISEKLSNSGDQFFGVKKVNGGVRFRISITDQKPKRFPRIAINCHKSPFLKLDLNPTKIGGDGFTQLREALKQILPDGLSTFATHGKVTRIDAALDLRPMAIDDMLALQDQTKTYRSYALKGKLETIYFGKRRGNHTRIYDKTKEQAKKGRSLASETIRVERVLRNTKLKLSNLASLSNAFNGMHLLCHVWPEPPKSIEPKAYLWRLFVSACTHEGTDVALKWLHDDKRITYRKYLKEQTHDWWKPQLIWEKWPDTAKELFASFCN